MTQEQAAAALHAAKFAQMNAMGRNLDKLPPGFLHPQLDISKISNSSNNQDFHKSLSLPSVTIEPAINNMMQKGSSMSSNNNGVEILKRSGEQMDSSDNNDDHLQNLNNNSSNNNNNTINSYSKEESSADEKNLSDDESIAVN